MEPAHSVRSVIRRLEELGDPESAEGMERYGITATKVYGVRIPDLRNLAKEIGTDHRFALELWEADSRETRILAAMIGDPAEVSAEMMDRWAAAFDSWEVTDQVCMNLFDRTRYNYQKAVEWSTHDDQFVKRAAFVLMAQRAVRDREAGDRVFSAFFPMIEAGASDERPYVKKAVNWALRQIGKRNRDLNRQAIELARKLKGSSSKPARWIGADAHRELAGEKVQKRLSGR